MIKYLFSDVDDTITTNGVLELEALKALYILKNNNIKTILVSGGSGGQALTYISQWPIDAIVTESGAYAYYRKDGEIKVWHNPELDMDAYATDRPKLLIEKVLNQVKKSRLSLDSFTRKYDIAFDHNQTKPKLTEKEINNIVNIAKNEGAKALVSSIHINCFYGNYNKKQALESFIPFYINKSLDEIEKESAFSGDSSNDEELFEYFTHSFAVANIKYHKVNKLPNTIVNSEGGKGFFEVVNLLNKII